MPRPLVLDASAAIAWIRDEPAGARVAAYLEARRRNGGEVMVPAHFWLEVANVLVRRYGHTATEVVEDVRDLDSIPVQTIDADRALWLLALVRMESLGLSAYDAAYLALTEAVEADLMTLDARLAAAAGPRAILLGPHRLGEVAAPYGSGADPLAKPVGGIDPDSGSVIAQFGEYVAELRRQALAG